MAVRVAKTILFLLVALLAFLVIVEAALRLSTRGALARRLRAAGNGGVTIACHGDSWTFGMGVPPEESYPAVLEATLDALVGDAGAVRVLNRGQPGFSTADVARSIRETLDRDAPDLVVVLSGLNDPPFPGGAFDLELAPAPAPERRAGLRRLRTVRALDALVARMRERWRPDRAAAPKIHPTWAGLSAIARLLAERRVPWLVVDYPLPCDHVTPHSLACADTQALRYLLRDFSDAAGVPRVDPQPAFTAGRAEDLFHPMYSTHPSAAGYRLLAREVAGAIVSRGLVLRIPADKAASLAELSPAMPATRRRPTVDAVRLHELLFRPVEYAATRDARGEIVQVTADRNRDGETDYVARYRGGRLVRLERTRDVVLSPGKPPAWVAVNVEGGRVLSEELDLDGDRFFENRRVYREENEVLALSDLDRDGRPGVREWFRRGRRIRREADLDRDGTADLFFALAVDGSLVSAHGDTDGDGRDDLWKEFRDEREVLIARDRNGDGKPDQWIRLDHQAGTRHVSTDRDFDGTADSVVDELLSAER